MQFNQPQYTFFGAPQHQYSNPQYFNPFQTAPQVYSCPVGPVAQGEGDIIPVQGPDGVMQFYFLPRIRYNQPLGRCVCNNIPCFCGGRGGAYNDAMNAWLVKSVLSPVPRLAPACCYSPLQNEAPYNNPANSCWQQQLTFHSDGATSTTDLHYFFPALRQAAWQPPLPAPTQTAPPPGSAPTSQTPAPGCCCNSAPAAEEKTRRSREQHRRRAASIVRGSCPVERRKPDCDRLDSNDDARGRESISHACSSGAHGRESIFQECSSGAHGRKSIYQECSSGEHGRESICQECSSGEHGRESISKECASDAHGRELISQECSSGAHGRESISQECSSGAHGRESIYQECSSGAHGRESIGDRAGTSGEKKNNFDIRMEEDSSSCTLCCECDSD